MSECKLQCDLDEDDYIYVEADPDTVYLHIRWPNQNTFTSIVISREKVRTLINTLQEHFNVPQL